MKNISRYLKMIAGSISLQGVEDQVNPLRSALLLQPYPLSLVIRYYSPGKL